MIWPLGVSPCGLLSAPLHTTSALCVSKSRVTWQTGWLCQDAEFLHQEMSSVLMAVSFSFGRCNKGPQSWCIFFFN